MFVEPGLPAALRQDPKPSGERRRPRARRVSEWDSLAEPMQLMVAAAALRRAAATIAFQAEALAREMEAGIIEDFGGPDALRLLSAIVRITSDNGAGDM